MVIISALARLTGQHASRKKKQFSLAPMALLPDQSRPACLQAILPAAKNSTSSTGQQQRYQDKGMGKMEAANFSLSLSLYEGWSDVLLPWSAEEEREREREKRESKKLLKRKELSMMGIPSWLSWPYLQDSIWWSWTDVLEQKKSIKRSLWHLLPDYFLS